MSRVVDRDLLAAGIAALVLHAAVLGIGARCASRAVLSRTQVSTSMEVNRGRSRYLRLTPARARAVAGSSLRMPKISRSVEPSAVGALASAEAAATVNSGTSTASAKLHFARAFAVRALRVSRPLTQTAPDSSTNDLARAGVRVETVVRSLHQV